MIRRGDRPGTHGSGRGFFCGLSEAFSINIRINTKGLLIAFSAFFQNKRNGRADHLNTAGPGIFLVRKPEIEMPAPIASRARHSVAKRTKLSLEYLGRHVGAG
jgi:hypothetical protein